MARQDGRGEDEPDVGCRGLKNYSGKRNADAEGLPIMMLLALGSA